MKPTERRKLGELIRESRDADRQLGRVLRLWRYLQRAKAGFFGAAFVTAVLIAFGWGFVIALGVGVLLLVLVEVLRRRNERQIARHEGVEL